MSHDEDLLGDAVRSLRATYRGERGTDNITLERTLTNTRLETRKRRSMRLWMAPLAAALLVLKVTRFRGHPEVRDDARGVFDGEAEWTTSAAILQP